MNTKRLQSAMEYLMTYGWAILIIAVVLGALFGLGFFNSANLAPKLKAGACQVYRPDGPGTVAFVNLAGTCNNELPQYVAKFNGATTNISIPSSTQMNGATAITISSWIYTTSISNLAYILTQMQCNPYLYGSALYINSGGDVWASLGPATSAGWFVRVNTNSPITANTWHHLVLTWASGNGASIYVDGASVPISYSLGSSSTSNTLGSMAGNIGSQSPSCSSSYLFPGYIANLQIYNSSLTSNEVASLYREGLGGVPLRLNNLVAWWPLNGDMKDYSGNFNNGNSTNLVFTDSWTSGYTAP